MEPPPTPTNLNPNHRLTKPRYGASAALSSAPRRRQSPSVYWPAGDVSDDASAPETAWLAPCLFPPGIASVVLAELGSRRRRCSLSAAGGPSGC